LGESEWSECQHFLVYPTHLQFGASVVLEIAVLSASKGKIWLTGGSVVSRTGWRLGKSYPTIGNCNHQANNADERRQLEF